LKDPLDFDAINQAALAAFPAFAVTARADDGTWLTLHLTRRA